MNLDLAVSGVRIEAVWYGPRPDQAPTLVLLHEGLGCVSMWRDFPQKLAERTGYGVLAYSRPGYGKSGSIQLPRPLDYMHREARDVLPRVLDQTGVKNTILVGHSDGASIAAIYSGELQDFRVRGLVLIAPHFFVEDLSLQSIAAAKVAYDTGDLRVRLARHHGENVDVAFRGWNEAWLDPGFRSWRIDDAVAHIRVPILIVQGKDDRYGTLAQVKLAETDAYCPVETRVLDHCGHSPHIDQPATTLEATTDFVHRVLAVHEGMAPAGPKNMHFNAD